MSNTLSRLIIGANQLSFKKRGYEITKKVRAILSPRFISRDFTSTADGASMSFNSSADASYISFGRIGEIEVVSFLGFRKSNSPILFCLYYWLPCLTWIEKLVEELDYLLCAKSC